MFKSALPIVSMFIGIVFYNRRYTKSDYAAVVFLVAGLIVFMRSGSATSPEATAVGIFLVLLSLFGSGSCLCNLIISS